MFPKVVCEKDPVYRVAPGTLGTGLNPFLRERGEVTDSIPFE